MTTKEDTLSLGELQEFRAHLSRMRNKGQPDPSLNEPLSLSPPGHPDSLLCPTLLPAQAEDEARDSSSRPSVGPGR